MKKLSKRNSFQFAVVMGGFPSGSTVKHLPARQETQEMWVQDLGREVPPEEEKATHSSILGRRMPWTEEPGGLQSMGSQKVRHD